MVMGSAGAPLGWISALLMALSACAGPLEAYRSARGIDKNDPDPATATFTANLAAADAAPYPNLATVPEPPTHASTAAEREALTRTLVTERTNLQQAAGVSPNAAAPVRRARVPPPSCRTPRRCRRRRRRRRNWVSRVLPSSPRPPRRRPRRCPPRRCRRRRPHPRCSARPLRPAAAAWPSRRRSTPLCRAPRCARFRSRKNPSCTVSAAGAGRAVAHGSPPSRSLMAAGTPSPAPAVPSLDPPPPPAAGRVAPPRGRRDARGDRLAGRRRRAGPSRTRPLERRGGAISREAAAPLQSSRMPRRLRQRRAARRLARGARTRPGGGARAGRSRRAGQQDPDRGRARRHCRRSGRDPAAAVKLEMGYRRASSEVWLRQPALPAAASRRTHGGDAAVM